MSAGSGFDFECANIGLWPLWPARAVEVVVGIELDRRNCSLHPSGHWIRS